MVKIIAGLMGTSVASGSTRLSSSDQLRPFLAMLRQHNIHELDTARVYNLGQSEQDLGSIPEASKQFSIATKAPGFSPGSLAYDKVIQNCNASLAALKQERIELYYFHGPDRSTPLEESCRAIQELWKEGKIRTFGVSNVNRDEVEEIHRICSQNGWVKPEVYQGGFNPISRAAETELFPTLRKLGMKFYAFSPLGGGYFSRTREQLENPPAGGRMDQMKQFKSIYVNDTSLRLHDALSAACEREGLKLKEATLRFLLYHSALGAEDGVILGASDQAQMEENLVACEKGPLPGSVVRAFETLWDEYKAAGLGSGYCV